MQIMGHHLTNKICGLLKHLRLINQNLADVFIVMIAQRTNDDATIVVN